MKRSLHMLVMAVVVVALLAGAAIAKEFKGKVSVIDAAGGKITVKKMLIMKKEFTADPAALQGIAEKDKVTVTYEKEGDVNKASKVEKQ